MEAIKGMRVELGLAAILNSWLPITWLPKLGQDAKKHHGNAQYSPPLLTETLDDQSELHIWLPTLPFKPVSVMVFGVHAKSMQCSFDSIGNNVPTILLLMQKYLYIQGSLQAEGIFRITVENSQEEFVRHQLNKGLVQEEIDMHCLAGLIKALETKIGYVYETKGLLLEARMQDTQHKKGFSYSEWEFLGDALQYVLNATFLASVYNDYLEVAENPSWYCGSIFFSRSSCCSSIFFRGEHLRNFARTQLEYIMGNNPAKMSDVVGFGHKYPYCSSLC